MADRCFRCSATPSLPEKPQAYAYFLGLYLGDGCISRTARPGVYILRIFCADAWPGLRQECAQVMQAVRPNNRMFVNQSRDTLRLCGEALNRLSIAWRYSKPNTISVARREAVATLDRFVGAKY